MSRPLLEITRCIVSAETWLRGVDFVRRAAVQFRAWGQEGWLFEIEEGRGAGPIKVMWDWSRWRCMCGAPEYCAHIVAAACTFRRAETLLAGLSEAPPPVVEFGHRIRVAEAGSLFVRVVRVYPFPLPDVPDIEFTLVGEEDSADPVLALMPRGAKELAVRFDHTMRVFAALRQSFDVRLDGVPIRVDITPVKARWIWRTSPSGEREIGFDVGDPYARLFFWSMAILTGDVLRPLDLESLLEFPSTPTSPVEAPEPMPGPAPAMAPDLPPQEKPGPAPAEPPILERPSPLPTPPIAPPAARPSPAAPAAPPAAMPSLAAPPVAPAPAPTPAPAPAPAPSTRPPEQPAPGTTPASDTTVPEPNGRPVLEPRWDTGGNEPSVTFHARHGDGRAVTASAEKVLGAWRAGNSAIKIVDRLVDLPSDWLERYGVILEQFVAARTQGKLPRWARPAAATLCQALHGSPPPELAGLVALAKDFSEIPVATLPPGLDEVLREYQRRGVDWLCLLRDAELGALLADDMGLGKTLQTLCALRGRTLVVAPTSTLHNWAAEAARFRPDLRVQIFRGQQRVLDPTVDLTLTSYAILRQDRKLFTKQSWDVVVLDEAQAIKQPTTITANAACELRARWRVALTGTPVQNKTTELWSLFQFLNPGLLGGLKEFTAQYGRAIENGVGHRIAELRTKVRPFLLRRHKSEVARELPPKTEVVLRCKLDAQERLVYDGLRLAGQAQLLPRLAAGGATIEAIELLLRLRQAACHMGLVPGQQASRSSKVNLLIAHLAEVTQAGHRALVFSQWTSLLNLVEVALRDAGFRYVRLDGQTEDRAGVVAAFQVEDGPPVMLISLTAGGVGLNLTAADHVYLLDPWWNPAVEDQAADRTHRIGQVRPVFVHRIVAEDTVEEKMLELHQRKRALAATAIEDLHEGGLSREDLLELLR